MQGDSLTRHVTKNECAQGSYKARLEITDLSSEEQGRRAFQ
jgi:hypothetical protein